jgi:hypothetical protein
VPTAIPLRVSVPDERGTVASSLYFVSDDSQHNMDIETESRKFVERIIPNCSLYPFFSPLFLGRGREKKQE